MLTTKPEFDQKIRQTKPAEPLSWGEGEERLESNVFNYYICIPKFLLLLEPLVLQRLTNVFKSQHREYLHVTGFNLLSHAEESITGSGHQKLS